MSLNYLATRFTCSWPWDILVMLCDGRMVCGCADPYGHRVLGDARADSVGAGLDGTGDQPAARGVESRRVVILRRLPLEAAAQEGRSPGRPSARRGSAARADVHRVHGRVQYLVRRGVLRPGDRHHADAAGRHARLRAVPARDRRGRSVAQPRRLLQLRRGVPPQAGSRDVRVHQDELPAHLPLYEHERPGVF